MYSLNTFVTQRRTFPAERRYISWTLDMWLEKSSQVAGRTHAVYYFKDGKDLLLTCDPRPPTSTTWALPDSAWTPGLNHSSELEMACTPIILAPGGSGGLCDPLYRRLQRGQVIPAECRLLALRLYVNVSVSYLTLRGAVSVLYPRR